MLLFILVGLWDIQFSYFENQVVPSTSFMDYHPIITITIDNSSFVGNVSTVSEYLSTAGGTIGYMRGTKVRSETIIDGQ